jgi:hypothetical protein
MHLEAIFVGFLLGLGLSFRSIRRPRRALVIGVLLGAAPLALMLGPGSAPQDGFGSVLYLAFFLLGPLMLFLFAVSGAALGVAGGAVVLSVGRGHARWVNWAIALTLIGICAVLTVLPVAQHDAAERQLAKDRDARTEAIMRADFKGTLAAHQVTFPASPRLHLFENCIAGGQISLSGCSTNTNLNFPVKTWTKPDEELLHERGGLISFRLIVISAAQLDCRSTDFCLTQEKIDRWCREYRADQADSIWCRDTLPMKFYLQTKAHAESIAHQTNRFEPELATRYSNTPLGPGQVQCRYHPDSSNTDKQGNSCKLTFNLADGVMVALSLSRTEIINADPALAATIALIPDYWAALTDEL